MLSQTDILNFREKWIDVDPWTWRNKVATTEIFILLLPRNCAQVKNQYVGMDNSTQQKVPVGRLKILVWGVEKFRTQTVNGDISREYSKSNSGFILEGIGKDGWGVFRHVSNRYISSEYRRCTVYYAVCTINIKIKGFTFLNRKWDRWYVQNEISFFCY